MVTLPEPGWLNRRCRPLSTKATWTRPSIVSSGCCTTCRSTPPRVSCSASIYVRKGHRDDGIASDGAGRRTLSLEPPLAPRSRAGVSHGRAGIRTLRTGPDPQMTRLPLASDATNRPSASTTCSCPSESTCPSSGSRLLAIATDQLPAVRYGPADGDGLSDALQATLHNHPAVAGQEAQVDAKRHAADAVRSQRYPRRSRPGATVR